tara:strand:+ start:12915 stop:13304 length:390 start_codon:yes stop_codon:yes gene_type:complete
MADEQITKGIKILVKTTYEGLIDNNDLNLHSFSYEITIKNKSKNTVQLTKRHWVIFDTLNFKEIVNGKGVVGETPILLPQDSYTYNSGTFLQSNIGSMKGFFVMKNINTENNFKVIVPSFQLITPESLN